MGTKSNGNSNKNTNGKEASKVAKEKVNNSKEIKTLLGQLEDLKGESTSGEARAIRRKLRVLGYFLSKNKPEADEDEEEETPKKKAVKKVEAKKSKKSKDEDDEDDEDEE